MKGQRKVVCVMEILFVVLIGHLHSQQTGKSYVTVNSPYSYSKVFSDKHSFEIEIESNRRADTIFLGTSNFADFANTDLSNYKYARHVIICESARNDLYFTLPGILTFGAGFQLGGMVNVPMQLPSRIFNLPRIQTLQLSAHWSDEVGVGGNLLMVVPNDIIKLRQLQVIALSNSVRKIICPEDVTTLPELSYFEIHYDSTFGFYPLSLFRLPLNCTIYKGKSIHSAEMDLLAQLRPDIRFTDTLYEDRVRDLTFSAGLPARVIRDTVVELHYANGVIELRGHIVNGAPGGTWEIFYPSGKKKQERHYANGEPIGKWFCWDESGEILFSSDYSAGNNSCSYEVYRKTFTGNVTGRIPLSNGIIHGNIKYAIQVIRSSSADKNSLVPIAGVYHQELPVVNGVVHGTSTLTGPNYKALYTFKNGILRAIDCYNADAILVAHGQFSSKGTGNFVEYSLDGKESWVVKFTRGFSKYHTILE